MAKIVIWGFTTTRTQEQISKLEGLQAKYDSLSLQIGKDKDTSVLKDCIVLIKHDSGIPKELSFQWMLMCSGRITEPKIDEANKEAGIPPNILVDNLDVFLASIEGKTVIEKQDIETLFSLDPELEELLQPFALANPFLITSDQGKALNDAKAKLREYVRNHLHEQGKL